ncbi:MAG: putative aminohydrolase SsnA [Candidatus Bipolaricaulota bacterium]|nr:putative aminohydrolase SsnA [Candidatus Bipolaricaulota bacterium]
MKCVIDGATIWDGANSLHEKGTIVIDGGKIEAVLTRDERDRYEIPTDAERIDGEGRLAIPGLVNAHTHLYSSLARGMALPNYSPNTFTQILEQLWWRLDKALDPSSVRMSALVGAMEAARCGVTTLIDHHASPHAVTGSLSAVKKAVNSDVGLRGAFCYELSDRDGMEIRDEGIEENLDFLSTDDPSDTMSTALFGLHASFTLSDDSLSKMAEVIPEGAGVHIHVAEGPEDEEQCQSKHGMRIVERLDKFNLLRDRSILAHCLHIDEDEKDLIAERMAIVVHNPRSNMNNGVGVFDMDGFLRRGITVGLGTDGIGANMLAELFTAGILQKVSTGNSLAAGFGDLQKILFDNNPQIASQLLRAQLGRIAPGYQADIALFDYDPPTPIDAGNVLGHLLFGIAVHDLRVSDLIVAGRSVIRDGHFANLDEDTLYAQAREEAAALWARIS